MLRFRCEHVISHIFFALLLAGMGGGAVLRGDTINYATDATFAGTTVNTTAFQGRSVPLAEILRQVERQSLLKFVYDADRLPMGAEVVVETAGESTRPLARLLTEISAQVAVMFKRRNGLIAVWGKGPDDVVVDETAAAGSSPETEKLAADIGANGRDSVPAASRVPGFLAAAAPAAATPENVTASPRPPGFLSEATSLAAAPEVPSLESPAIGSPEIESAGQPGEILQLEKFKVEGKTPTNSVVALRQKAAVAVDMLTSRDFSKFIATDVSDIVIRMPGFSTTTRGSFAVVRGLAERYNPITLDGILLPSSDPERQTPELDLFPTRLVDAIVVNKVFEPRLPGTASGGAVDLRTRPLPEGRFAQVQFGVRAESGALSNGGFLHGDTVGLWDQLALGAKDRPTAALGPADWIKRSQNPDTKWQGQPGSFPLGTRFSLVYENRLDLGGDGRALGYSFNVGYDSSASSEDGRVFSTKSGVLVGRLPGLVTQDGTLVANVTGENYSEYEQEVKIGALLNLGYAINLNHTLSLSLFVSQIGVENVTRTANGFDGINGNTPAQLELLYDAMATGTIAPAFQGVADAKLTHSETLYYRQRNLTNLKLSGEHKFEGERASRLDWSVANIQASQEDPDFSYLSYGEYFPANPATSRYEILYGQFFREPTRFWREVKEKTWAGRLDWEKNLDLGWMNGAVARMGLYHDATQRSFQQRSFFLTGGSASTGDTLEELVTDLRGSDFNGARGFGTSPADATADRRLTAAHLSLALPLLAGQSWADKLDLLLGARVEKFQFTASGSGRYSNLSSIDYYITPAVAQKLRPNIVDSAASTVSRELNETTVHPAASLTWSPFENFNVRLGYSRTVARPSFREMGPYFTNDEVTNEVQHGNIFLNTSEVDNYDLRLEYFFPKSRDLVALSVFAKKIENPIEKQADVITSGGFNALGWFNNPEPARLKGAELEVAKNLGFLGEVGSWFSVGGNGTYIEAEAVVGQNESGVPGDKRNLFDQPDWIANAYFTFEPTGSGFSSTLSWFAISDVLRNVSADRWATYVASHSRLDLTLSQRFGRQWLVRFSAKNLSDPERKFIADPEVTTEEIVYRRFKDGRNYSLTATYDF